MNKLTRLTPDLIILDMTMPGMGGIGFLKEITDESGNPRYPVLVLTARANMAEFFANVNIDGFIAKPCEPKDLLMEVARIMFLRGDIRTVKPEAVQTVYKRKVLIAEDDAPSNVRLMNAFVTADFEVVQVKSGPEVLEKAIVEKPDVIVMNRILTGMNGDAVSGMLQQMPNTRGIPVVLYDVTDEDTPASKYVDAGIGVRQFVKDNKPAAVISAVRDALGE